MLSIKGKYLLGLALLAGSLWGSPLLGASLGSSKFQLSSLKRIKADSWNVVGKNVVLEGNVYIPFGDLEIFADKAIINADSKDVDASGNIQLFRWQQAGGSVSPVEFAELQRKPNVRAVATGITGTVWGEQKLTVQVSALTDNLRADRLVGNIESGYFSFENVQLMFKTFVCRAEFGERKPDGVITVKNAEVSACNYLEQDNAHYSISCDTAELTPHKTEFFGLENIDTDPGDHSVFLANGWVKVYGVPVMWLPVFYKPKDESPGFSRIRFGEASDWGYFVSVSRRFQFLNYPHISVRALGDYYSKRGYGYGADALVVTEESKTDIFAYNLWDFDSNLTDNYDQYRIRIPKDRYDFRISNVTHITPRLDFRGVMEISSDPYFVRDFFSDRYNADPQPATYAALEQQFDHFSASVYVRPKLNSFYTTSERLPALEFDVQRQEILNSNFYYQGDLSMGYMKMDWVSFDESVKQPKPPLPHYTDLKNYEAFRLDTTHFLYYPLRLNWLTLVPRAGFKMTAYSNSSKQEVDEESLITQFQAADLQNLSGYYFNNYDDDGGARLRFAGEIGIEASTKIYNSWQDVKSNWLKVDGLRHVMRPFINYTYIPKPTEDRDHLYYFDDIDRIDEQNFMRFGVENRLQTRSGNGVRNILAMENYWDLYFNKQDDLGHIGDFCTILTASPLEGLSISSLFAIDIGGNNEDNPEVVRNGREVGHPGLNVKWLNRWSLTVNYMPVQDFNFNLSYMYSRPYRTRSAFSMGSTLTQLEAGRFFDRIYTSQTEQIQFGMSFPLTPDRRTFGAYTISYDVNEGYMASQTFQVTRKFHCVEAAFMYQIERDTGADDNESNYDSSFMFSVRLVGLEGPLQSTQNSMLQSANNGLNGIGGGNRNSGFGGF